MTRAMLALAFLTSVIFPSAGALAQAAGRSVPHGVYDCFGPSKAGGRSPDSWEGIRSVGTQLDAGGKFSVLGPDLYLSRGGKTGHFRFDGHTLSMVDGPYAGIRYHKVSDWSFRMLRANGDEGPFMCPINVAKDPRNPQAW
ncbi:MAG: hypothetical protein WDM91_21455 [Rhizomicrobium sp.]